MLLAVVLGASMLPGLVGLWLLLMKCTWFLNVQLSAHLLRHRIGSNRLLLFSQTTSLFLHNKITCKFSSLFQAALMS